MSKANSISEIGLIGIPLQPSSPYNKLFLTGREFEKLKEDLNKIK